MASKFTFNALTTRLLRYFFQGLLILAPIGITAFAIYWGFQTIDNLLPLNLVPEHTPLFFLRYKGVGFVMVLFLIILVGYLSSSFILGRLFDLFDHALERTPFVKYIYSSIKDVFDAFVGEKKKFDHPVLAQIYGEDVWEVGFITQQDMSAFGLTDYMAVYCPQSYAIAGKVYLVPKHKVRILENITAAEAMKFVVSGGVTTGHVHGPVLNAEGQDVAEDKS